MKAFAFIRQPSFAKYIMADITLAFRRTGWDVGWMDLEERTRAVRNEGREGIQGLIRNIRDDVSSFDPGLVLSYGLEYFCDGRQIFGHDFDRPLNTLLERPAVNFLSLVFLRDLQALPSRIT